MKSDVAFAFRWVKKFIYKSKDKILVPSTSLRIIFFGHIVGDVMFIRLR